MIGLVRSASLQIEQSGKDVISRVNSTCMQYPFGHFRPTQPHTHVNGEGTMTVARKRLLLCSNSRRWRKQGKHTYVCKGPQSCVPPPKENGAHPPRGNLQRRRKEEKKRVKRTSRHTRMPDNRSIYATYKHDY